MKTLFAVIALAFLLGTLPAPTAQEFNVAVCMATSFTENHLVISSDEKKLSFVSDLGDDGAVVERKDPIICDITDSKTENGITGYVAACSLDKDTTVNILALTDGKKFVAQVKIKGELVSAIYGVAGPESKLGNYVLGSEKADMDQCITLAQMDVKDIPAALVDYLQK